MDTSQLKDLAYRGLAAALGGPVDLASMVMRPFGYQQEKPVMGGEWIGERMEEAGIVSQARDPLGEFAASLVFPSPAGLETAMVKGMNIGLPAIGAMMAGRGANTADLGKLEEAQKLTEQGIAPKQIWETTGWAKGPDDKWRFEIDDSESILRGGQENFENLVMNRYQDMMRSREKIPGEPLYLEDVLFHEKLFDAYPSLRKAEVSMIPADSLAKGVRSGDTISIRADLPTGEAREVKLHEIQHIIQEIEDFSPGGGWKQFYRSPEDRVADYQKRIDELGDKIADPNMSETAKLDLTIERQELQRLQSAAEQMTPEMAKKEAFEKYYRLAGEAEARQTMSRADMPMEERMSQFVYDPENFFWETGVRLDELNVPPPK